MTRFIHRRLILVVALLCQVATAVHTPVAHAMADRDAPHALSHCADHARPLPANAGEQTSAPTSGRGARSGHLCSCGLCQCPCAQAAALADALPLSTAIPHLPVTLAYRTPDLPPLANAFFRPPI